MKTLVPVFLTIVVTLSFATTAHAVMRADFPDSTSLQPMPQQAHADISHSVSRSGDIQIVQTTEADEPGEPNSQVIPIAGKSISYSALLLGIAVAALLVAGVVKLIQQNEE